MPYRERLCRRLPAPVAARVRALGAQEAEQLEEIRVRLGRRMELIVGGGSRMLDLTMDRAQMDELLAALSGYALYRYEAQLAQGFIPLDGGHRAGVCGQMTLRPDGTAHMAQVSSVCIRISRPVPGAGSDVYPFLLTEDGRASRVLLLGPPGCGKTTVLRDCAVFFSDHAGLRVAAADEREELAGADCGARTDILAGLKKSQAIPILIRTMSPQVVITDEIGKTEDTEALLDAVRCGIGLTATAHAGGMEDVMSRPTLRRLYEAGAFDWYVLLGRRGCVRGAWNGAGKAVMREEKAHDDMGYGGDGDDSGQRRRFSSL